jgi:hypothetical protein
MERLCNAGTWKSLRSSCVPDAQVSCINMSGLLSLESRFCNTNSHEAWEASESTATTQGCQKLNGAESGIFRPAETPGWSTGHRPTGQCPRRVQVQGSTHCKGMQGKEQEVQVRNKFSGFVVPHLTLYQRYRIRPRK